MMTKNEHDRATPTFWEFAQALLLTVGGIAFGIGAATAMYALDRWVW